MTRKKKPKPKFRAGEVAYYKTRSVWVRIRGTPDAEGHYCLDGHDEGWAHESELRRLTKREHGR